MADQFAWCAHLNGGSVGKQIQSSHQAAHFQLRPWTVKWGLGCPTLHLQRKMSWRPSLLVLCHTKHILESLADLPKRVLRKSLILSALSIQTHLSVIVFDIFCRFQDHCTALSGVIVLLDIYVELKQFVGHLKENFSSSMFIVEVIFFQAKRPKNLLRLASQIR